MIRFTKMHGIGNDYVYVNCFEESIANPAEVSRKISDRHFGIGSDGLILVMHAEQGVAADVRMRMFNADGSESEMCGNGIRCVCKLAHDRGISRANPMRIQTGRGVLSLAYTTGPDGMVNQVTVDMGEPIFEPAKVPYRPEELADLLMQLQTQANMSKPVSALVTASSGVQTRADKSSSHRTTDGIAHVCVSMGNPHIVFFVSNLAGIALGQVGPLVEFHAAFPKRVNAHFVQVHSRHEVTMKTWERGSGATLACGTGAAAVCAAGVTLDLIDRDMLAHLPGGDLTLRWDKKTNHVFKTGPATEVFQGEWRE